MLSPYFLRRVSGLYVLLWLPCHVRYISVIDIRRVARNYKHYAQPFAFAIQSTQLSHINSKMSFSSSYGSSPSTSPSSCASSIQIGFTPPGSRPVNSIPVPTTQSSHYSSCAYPSWPSKRPSAYISDEDLFGDDDAPRLSEPPAPPRPAEMWAVAQPLLPPVTQSRRRSSTHHHRKHSKSSSVKK